MFKIKLANEKSYTAIIARMRLRLLELQKTNFEAQKLGQQRLHEGSKKVDGVLHHQSLLFVPKVIQIELISHNYNDSQAGYFGIKTTRKLLAQKYFWPFLQYNIETYVKSYNVCLALKVVKHKLYSDLQYLPVPTYWWKDLSIDFVTELPISTNW